MTNSEAKLDLGMMGKRTIGALIEEAVRVSAPCDSWI